MQTNRLMPGTAMGSAALDHNLQILWNREAPNPHNLPRPGVHGLIIADVDDDGPDEIILGATAQDLPRVAIPPLPGG